MGMIRRPQPNSRVDALCKSLYELALQKGPKAKLPTARELCLLFDVSRSTLNDALNVLEMRDVVFRRQSSGIYVSPKIYRKTIYILLYSRLFLADRTSPFWGMLWALLAQEAEKRSTDLNEYYNFHMILQPAEHELALPEDVYKQVLAGKVDAILSMGSHVPAQHWLEEQHVPTIVFAGWGDWIVAVDTNESFRLAISSLARLGCRSIGFWGGVDLYSECGDAETHLFRDALLAHNLPFDPDLVKYGISFEERAQRPEGMIYQDQGFRLAMEVFGKPDGPRPDGLFIGNDMMTAGALVAFQSLGIRVGQDVQVATHANAGSPTLYGYSQKLIQIEVDPAAIVQEMFAILDLLLAGETPSQERSLLLPELREY